MTNFSEKSYVNVGLMITIIVGVWYLSGTLATMESAIKDNGENIKKNGKEMVEIKSWQILIDGQLHTNKELKDAILSDMKEIKIFIKDKD